MRRFRLVASIGLLLTVLASGCAAPSPRETALPHEAAKSAAAPSRLVASINADPAFVVPRITKTLPGSEVLEGIVHASPAVVNEEGNLAPRLAESVPSIDNGLWKLLPDGRMEMTYKLKPNLRWHDGAPFSAEDLAFTVRIGLDPDLPYFRHRGYLWVEDAQALDPLTFVLRWKQPYVWADTVFVDGGAYVLPIPRHIMEQPYLAAVDDREKVLEHPYWAEEFVGMGPFKLREFARGRHAIFEAYDGYVLGRPKIDVVEIRFFLDKGAIIANLLAGTIDTALGRGFALEEAMSVRDGWLSGRLEASTKNLVRIFPQFLNPDPPIIGNVQFRRALMHAMNRQEMVDTIQRGMVPVANHFLSPNDPSFKATEAAVVRYDYDPRRSVQLIEELGYRRGSDGMFRDNGNQRISVELRTTTDNTVHESASLVVADNWKSIGVAAEPYFAPRQLQANNEFRATFPGFELIQHPNEQSALLNLHSRETSLPENGFNQTGNRPRYMNPQFDALIDRFAVTIPRAEREQVLGQIVHHMSDQLTMMFMFYQTDPLLMSNRLQGARSLGPVTPVWNIHEWEVK